MSITDLDLITTALEERSDDDVPTVRDAPGALAPEAQAEGVPAPAVRRRRDYDSSSHGVMVRRGYPIRCFVGPNGSGKTAVGVATLLPSMRVGRPILSTVPLYESPGVLYRNYIRFTEWPQMLEPGFKHADIFMDEITGIANARDAMGMPRPVQALLDKLRKIDVTLTWTAPAWTRADTSIRSTTQLVTLCRSYLPAKAVVDGTTGEISAWRPKKLIRARSFNAMDFEEFSVDRTASSAQKRRRLRPVNVEWIWGPGSRMFDSYDTLDAVSRVGEVLDSGRCANCGGKRPIPTCKCGDH